MTSSEQTWLACYKNLAPNKVLEQFIPLLGDVWQESKDKFSSTSKENDVTRTLYYLLVRKCRDRLLAWGICSQAEDVELDIQGVGHAFSYHDLRLSVSCHEYIYECKRLGCIGKATTYTEFSNNYVQKGMIRFLQPSPKQYSKDPQYRAWCGFAGMIGYVLEGDPMQAADALIQSITKHAPAHTIERPTFPPPPDGITEHFLTCHTACNNSPVDMHHILLALNE